MKTYKTIKKIFLVTAVCIGVLGNTTTLSYAETNNCDTLAPKSIFAHQEIARFYALKQQFDHLYDLIGILEKQAKTGEPAAIRFSETHRQTLLDCMELFKGHSINAVKKWDLETHGESFEALKMFVLKPLNFIFSNYKPEKYLLDMRYHNNDAPLIMTQLGNKAALHDWFHMIRVLQQMPSFEMILYEKDADKPSHRNPELAYDELLNEYTVMRDFMSFRNFRDSVAFSSFALEAFTQTLTREVQANKILTTILKEQQTAGIIKEERESLLPVLISSLQKDGADGIRILDNIRLWQQDITQLHSYPFNPFAEAERAIENYIKSPAKPLTNIQVNLGDTSLGNSDLYIKMSVADLQDIIYNLFSNSIDALENKEAGNITINFSLEEIDEHPHFRMNFSDNGEGMKPEVLEKLRSKIQTTTKGALRGTGLGTQSIFETVDKYNGKVEIDSTLGKGSSFVFTFPLYVEGKEIKDINTKIASIILSAA